MSCPICQKSFNSDRNVERHRTAVHEEKKSIFLQNLPTPFKTKYLKAYQRRQEFDIQNQFFLDYGKMVGDRAYL